MMRNKYLTFLGTGLLLLASACTDGYESEPVERFTLDYLFSKTDSMGVQSKRFLSDIYDRHLYYGHNRVGGNYLDAASDDAISIITDDPDVYKLAVGRYSANTRIWSDMEWGEYYQGIRKANILINNIDVVPFKLTYKNAKGEKRPLNASMKAEARFLRANSYFELVKRYGGVPLMGDEVHELGDNMEIPRSTFAQCIEYIVDELDAIKDELRTLPMEDAGQYGHTPSKEACMAMKARVLLYAASPLFNEKTVEPGNELIGYASFDPNRWQIAAEAAEDVIKEFGPEGAGTLGLTNDFCKMFLDFYNRTENPEIIFTRQTFKSKDIEYSNGPLGFTGSATGFGRTNPTENLVESFPMKDGKMPGDSQKYTYQENNPYINRDPRLDFTILHQGSSWLGKQLQTYFGGMHNPSTAQYNRTSYYMRKFMGLYDREGTEYQDVIHMWVMFRYAEVLLNYAEALNESLSTPSDEVYNTLIALRKRAGIEAGDDGLYGLAKPMDKIKMRGVIQNERRIEMAFEEQRYWDIRRWRLAETIFDSPLHGMYILKKGEQYTYQPVEVFSTKFDVKRYFYPIPYSEVIMNKNMVQNPNW